MANFKAPLNTYTPHKKEAILNRLYTLLHFLNISSIIYYRLTTYNHTTHNKPLWLLIFTSELFISFYSLLSLAYSWRRVTRTVFLERLPEDEKLPAIDVFVFTSDPQREPALQVMNTVVSCMALDYPPEKINVYLSDDGGFSFTLEAAKEGFEFARLWVPFCRKYKIITTCPKAYFGSYDYGSVNDDFGNVDYGEFMGERKDIEEKYNEFRDRIDIAQENAQRNVNELAASRDHSPVIEVINYDSKHAVDSDQAAKVKLPSLIYVAREKRPHHPHHFKAGAINALLRVSGIITNSPYVLVLDSDMYSNDPSSARQSMCFHLDPNISASLAFVQYPQRFHNVNISNDIYDGQIRHVFQVKWTGIDGLEGPILSGTCFYLKREAAFGDIHPREISDLPQLKTYYGLSNEFIKSLQENTSTRNKQGNNLSSTQLSEAKFVASSTYEQNTKWGEMWWKTTSQALRCIVEGGNRPAFLGTATINLNDALIQTTRWYTGFVDVAFSRFFPLFYGPFVGRLGLLQSMCYAYFAIQPLCCFPLWCFATYPQLCLLLGIPLYPQATSPWFLAFSFALLSGLSKNLVDVLITGGSTKTWWNDERFWLMKGVTSSLYGTTDCIMKKIGLREASFTTTNKVNDNERIELYDKGQFDFRASNKFIIPLAGLVIFNLTSFIVGILRVIILAQWSEFLGQIALSFFVILVGYPVIEAMMVRTDNASVSASVSLKSAVFTFGLFVIGYVFLYV